MAILFGLAIGNASSTPEPGGISCQPDSMARLTADHCVNAWTSKTLYFRWPDLGATCKPGSFMCDAAGGSYPDALSVKSCRDVRLLKTLPYDHLALIECGNQKYFINADVLACHDPNTLNYGLRSGETSETSPSEVGEFVVAQAEAKMKEIRGEADEDAGLLLGRMSGVEPGHFFTLMKLAHIEIGDMFIGVCHRGRFNFQCDPIDGHTVGADENEVRSQRTCRLLRFSYESGSRLLLGGTAENMKERVADTLFQGDRSHPSETLSVRMLLFYALKGIDPGLPHELHLIRKSVETGVTFWELHGGFVYGGHRLGANSGGGYDCTDFLSSLLTGSGTGGRDFSTQELKRIARDLGNESIGAPLSSSERKLESCFTIVRPRKGESLEPGDIVISKSNTYGTGHATIVKRALDDLTIETIEAAGGGSNAVTYKTRPLQESQPTCEDHETRLPIRSDLYFLRIKSARPRSCPLLLNHQ